MSDDLLIQQEIARRLAEEPPLPRNDAAWVLTVRLAALKMKLAQILPEGHGAVAPQLGVSCAPGCGGHDNVD